MFASINILVVSCKPEDPADKTSNHLEYFESKNEYGMYKESTVLIEYNAVDYQLIQANDKSVFCISNDTASKYVEFGIIESDALSDSGKKMVEINTKSTVNGANSKHVYVLIKSDEAKEWYWNSQNNIGIVIMK